MSNTYTPTISVQACGKEFTLERAASLEDLWDNMVNDSKNHDFDDERLPYWTELWPSSVALAEWLYLQKEHIKNKICLDVGCGLGFTALVGYMLGAKVLAFDYEVKALHFAHKNTLINDFIHENRPINDNTSGPLWFAMDWRKPAIQARSIDFIWGGDVMYERKFAYDLLNFIDYALSNHGRAYIAEPCRSVYEHFQAELVRRKWHVKKVHNTSIKPIYAQPVPVTVQIWEIWR